jgi:hypothetical protein
MLSIKGSHIKNTNRITLGSMISHPERFRAKKIFIVLLVLPPDMENPFRRQG